MKIFNKIIAFLLLGAFIGITSCSNIEDNNIFDQDPSVRLQETQDLLKNNLVGAENGWIMTFFPSNKLKGGYSFWFDFNEDGSVQVRSDYNVADLSVKNERYDFVLLTTVALNFPLGSTVHKFVAENPGTNTTDIEFLFDRYEGDDIVFRGHSTRNEIRMTKATADDKKFDLSSKMAMREIVRTMKRLYVTSGIESTTYGFNYNANSRFARVAELTGPKTPINKNGGVGIGFKNNGIILNEAVDVDGIIFDELVYDSGSNMFKMEKDGVSILLTP